MSHLSVSQSEKEMEDALIAQLTKGISQWTLRENIKTEDDLWANFREKLNQNNIDVLQGKVITDHEFQQIQEKMRTKGSSFYKAGKFLAGEKGIAKIELVRDDVKEGTVSLRVINNREVAGGQSVYEVIHQYQSKPGNQERDRRYDVTLLINGLPLIQIELKKKNVSYMDAVRQIEKYGSEGQFRGLMGFLQMFVVTNGVHTFYFAADNQYFDKKNGKVVGVPSRALTAWVDKDNHPVHDYLEFATQVLNVPMAHYLVGRYSVLDSSADRVILLRPYQIHAIEAIRKAARKHQSGFIWHTTGSGKTITAYNTLKNLLDMDEVDKTLFLIDRKALDTQTGDEFKAYAAQDFVDVDTTSNTKDLERKLLADKKQAIVTTIQKLQCLLREYSQKNADADKTEEIRKKYKKLRGLHIAFIVDECHRTVTYETMQMLKNYFTASLWYGFTGTPIFNETYKPMKKLLEGGAARPADGLESHKTTEQLYGPALHTYTIQEAILNQAVLGFNVEYRDHMTVDELVELGAELKAGTKKELSLLPRERLEEKVLDAYEGTYGKDFYDNDEHRREVVRFILQDCAGKFGLNRGNGDTFDAILTVGSIREAQRYYQLLKEMVQQGEVPEAVREKLVDFPKFAITYTVGENQDGALANQQAMKESLADYNQMFGTHFGLEDNLRMYNEDLQKRLARKKDENQETNIYEKREEQLDLVIVVNRLLTGFDAPCLSTLFVDRPPMLPQNIIQSFSRTNRTYDQKPAGQIVVFRTPALYKKAVDDATYLYSNGGTSSDLIAPTYPEMKKKLDEAVAALRRVAGTPSDVDLRDDTAILQAFTKAYQKFDAVKAAISMYAEWNYKILKDEYHFTDDELDNYVGDYVDVVEELKKRKEEETPSNGGASTTGEEGSPDPLDIDYELESTTDVHIDYKYIVELIQKYLLSKDVLVMDPADGKKIEEGLDRLAKSTPSLAGVIRSVWEKIKENRQQYAGKSAMDLVDEEINAIIRGKAEALAKTWYLPVEDIERKVKQYQNDENLMNKDETLVGIDLDAGCAEYKKHGGKLLKVMYFNDAQKDIRKVIKEEIIPLLQF